jgi:hypothetical protein
MERLVVSTLDPEESAVEFATLTKLCEETAAAAFIVMPGFVPEMSWN